MGYMADRMVSGISLRVRPVVGCAGGLVSVLGLLGVVLFLARANDSHANSETLVRGCRPLVVRKVLAIRPREELSVPARRLDFSRTYADLERGRATLLAALLVDRSRAPATIQGRLSSDADQLLREREARAQRHLSRVARTAGLSEARVARRALERVRAVRLLAARPGASSDSGAMSSRAGRQSVQTIQALLAPTEAFVSYGTLSYGAMAGEVQAVVITAAASRAVSLGSDVDLKALEQGCLPSDPEQDLQSCKPRLRRRLVVPLDLPDHITRLFLSTDGTVARLPFTWFVPQWTIVRVPSAQVLGLLHQRRRPTQGRGVLAFGDARYAIEPEGRRVRVGSVRQGLPPLPATRSEVQRVGGQVFVGDQASESRLRAILKDRRSWRAIHLAGHGVLDLEQPLHSGFVLSSTAQDDGLLAVHEVLRLRIGASLVVLSGCETALGGGLENQQSIGLSPAFLTAGAESVLSSLWRVDDESTRALMVRFYELWNPRGQPGNRSEVPEHTAELAVRSKSAALRQAQAFVRGHEKWRHPYYWAGWVLWGTSA